MYFLFILVGRHCRGVARISWGRRRGGERGHTLAIPGYLLVCHVDIHAVFIESGNLSDEQ